MKGNGEIVRILKPGESVNIQSRGEFVYLSEGLGKFRVTIGHEGVTMQAGDSRRFAQPFDEFEVTNLSDSERRAVFVVGFGDFDRFIVKGEIQVEPGLRAADGSFRTDTRQDIGIVLEPQNLVLTAYSRGQQLDAAERLRNYNNAELSTLPTTRVFSASGGLMGICQSTAGFSITDLWLVDPVNMAVVTRTNHHIGNGIDQGYSDLGGYFGLTADRLYFKSGSSDTGEVLIPKPNNESVSSVCFVPTRNFYVTAANNRDYIVFDHAGQLLKSGKFAAEAGLQTGNSVKIRYNPTDDTLSVFTRGSQAIESRFDLDLNHIETIPSTTYLADVNGVAFDSKNHIFDIPSSGPLIPKKRVWKAFTTKPEFRATRRGCGATAILKSEPLQVSADIEAVDIQTGVKISGEVIAAAIEFYYGRRVPADYLDHVYGFTASRDGQGLRFFPVNTGNRSFAAAGISDDFELLTPTEIVIKIDNELKLGAAL